MFLPPTLLISFSFLPLLLTLDFSCISSFSLSCLYLIISTAPPCTLPVRDFFTLPVSQPLPRFTYHGTVQEVPRCEAAPLGLLGLGNQTPSTQAQGVAGHVRDGGGGGARVRRGGRAHERPQRQDQLPGAPARGRRLRRQGTVGGAQRQAAQVLQGRARAVTHLPPPRHREVPHRRLAEARRRARRSLQLGHDRGARQPSGRRRHSAASTGPFIVFLLLCRPDGGGRGGATGVADDRRAPQPEACRGRRRRQLLPLIANLVPHIVNCMIYKHCVCQYIIPQKQSYSYCILEDSLSM